MVVASSAAAGAKEEVSLVDVMAFEDILSNLLFFYVVLEDVDFVEGVVFQGDIEPVKSGAVVRAWFVVDFFPVFGEDFAD